MSQARGGPQRMVVDAMLGRLARWLRLLGYDAPLVERPPLRLLPGEVLLTRRSKLKHKDRVFWVEHDHLEDQLAQVIKGLGLEPDPGQRFTRCGDCNQPVGAITRQEAMGRVPEHTLHTAAGFTRCPGCGKIFWPGSHGQRFDKLIDSILAEQGEQS